MHPVRRWSLPVISNAVRRQSFLASIQARSVSTRHYHTTMNLGNPSFQSKRFSSLDQVSGFQTQDPILQAFSEIQRHEDRQDIAMIKKCVTSHLRTGRVTVFSSADQCKATSKMTSILNRYRIPYKLVELTNTDEGF